MIRALPASQPHQRPKVVQSVLSHFDVFATVAVMIAALNNWVKTTSQIMSQGLARQSQHPDLVPPGDGSIC